jgi:NAD(P)-dependent dehydrogenase (short-subunit alcohol dehydrogenase family)
MATAMVCELGPDNKTGSESARVASRKMNSHPAISEGASSGNTIRRNPVNGVAPATVVQGSAMFPRDRVIGSLAKYSIPFKEDEATDSLVSKLAQFYADRTLTKSPITPADQAEAYFLLISKRLSKTTGQIITVDGGLHEAVLR